MLKTRKKHKGGTLEGLGSHGKEFGLCFMDKCVYQFPVAAVKNYHKPMA